MKILKEFKEFAVKGNMIDIAIGVIIGAAFNKLVDVLVKDIILPPLSLLTGGIHWGDKKLVLKEAVTQADTVLTEEIAIGYGKFIDATMDFLIIGFTIFLVVKMMNKLRAKAEDPKNKVVATPKNIELLTQMNDLLKEQNELLRKNSN
tara:strand:+ start:177743 stop:178186 length:444 start_codon:yes stop_codon:yes gene_type:complete